MQGSFRVVDSWCKTKGLSVNSEKTEVLFFTRKKKTEEVKRLEYQGVKLNLKKEVKDLGVILDDKLMWKALVRAQVKKELKYLWSSNAYVGRTWGLSPKGRISGGKKLLDTFSNLRRSSRVPEKKL